MVKVFGFSCCGLFIIGFKSFLLFWILRFELGKKVERRYIVELIVCVSWWWIGNFNFEFRLVMLIIDFMVEKYKWINDFFWKRKSNMLLVLFIIFIIWRKESMMIFKDLIG